MTKRRVRVGGELARDIRAIREPLRDARNATVHVGSGDEYYDARLFTIAHNPESVGQIVRTHTAVGALLLNEIRARPARRQQSKVGPGD